MMTIQRNLSEHAQSGLCINHTRLTLFQSILCMLCYGYPIVLVLWCLNQDGYTGHIFRNVYECAQFL